MCGTSYGREECFGSGHAALALRQDWQQQLNRTATELGARSVRFHGIFDDDVGIVRSVSSSDGTIQWVLCTHTPPPSFSLSTNTKERARVTQVWRVNVCVCMQIQLDQLGHDLRRHCGCWHEAVRGA